MRPHLFDPTADDPRLSEAVALGRKIYALHEAGANYSIPLKQLGMIAGHPIHRFSVLSGFGSVTADTFAKRQLVDWDQIPTDVTRAEMLEMVDGLCGITQADELQREFWLACLRTNTGDQKISDLIFWPGSYFGDGDDTRVMSSAEILATALDSGENSR